MHDDATDDRTEAFLEELRLSFRVHEAPTPGPTLTPFFTALTNDKGDLPVTAGSNAIRSASQMAGLPNWTRRRIDMMKNLLSQLSAKIAAGALGAVLAAGGLGAAGIGPVSLASHENDGHECVELDEVAETFDVNIVVCEVAEKDSATVDEEGDDVSADDAETLENAGERAEESKEVIEGELPPAPTTTSEAAQIHAFDEACGNHGMYVSFFAQMGFEPPCALLVRAGEEPSEDLTKQERKKVALALRKECKARAKTGDPCTVEEFAPTGGEEQQDTSQTDTSSEEQDAATTATAAEADTSTAEADAGNGNGKDKAQRNEKSKARGGKSGPRGGKGNK